MSLRERNFHRIVSGEARDPASAIARGLLRVLSGPYAAGVAARRGLYRLRLAPTHEPPAPTISVGNITVGGSGKTPMVAWVVNRLDRARLAGAILTRGYKADPSGHSDEADWLRGATGAPVVVNPDRVAGAAEAMRTRPDALVLDDGFQHVRLRRDLDIVCIDATCPFGYGALLPRGLLREPLTALRRADVLVVTRSDQVEPRRLEEIRARLAELAPEAEVFAARHQPTGWEGPDGSMLAPQALAGKRALAFCGLARPGAFFRTLEDLDVVLADRLAFDDHAEYDHRRLEQIADAAEAVEADVLVCTTKDRVKLPPGTPRLYALHIVMRIDPPDAAERLAERIVQLVRRRSR